MWKDLCYGKFSSCHYLLQGKRIKNGKVKFRLEKKDGDFSNATIKIEDLKGLTPPNHNQSLIN